MDYRFTNLDSEPELWYALAGPVVQIPPVNSSVYYFVQGHLEHCCIESLDMVPLGFEIKPPRPILCTVDSVNYLADPRTDQVFTKFRLSPVLNHLPIKPDDSLYHNPARPPDQIKIYPETTVRKILERQSELPSESLRYSIKYDLHGIVWVSERTLVTNELYIGKSWFKMLSQKRVGEGDIILFIGDKRYGILRGKRRTYGDCYGLGTQIVAEAILALNINMPFEVYYYPRVDTPEFVVNAARVEAAMRNQYHYQVGRSFSMQYEDERSSVAQTCRGTISSVEDVDHENWPNSPWRRIQVIMEPPYLNLNEMRVNPWMLKLEDTGESSSSSHDVEPDLSVDVTSYQALLQDAINVNRSD